MRQFVVFFTFTLALTGCTFDASTHIGPATTTQSCADGFQADRLTYICYACTVEPSTTASCDKQLIEKCQNEMPGRDFLSPDWLDFLSNLYAEAWAPEGSPKKAKKLWKPDLLRDLNYSGSPPNSTQEE